MNFLFTLEHGDELFDFAGASFGFFHGLDTPEDRVPVRPVETIEKCLRSRMSVESGLKIFGHSSSAR